MNSEIRTRWQAKLGELEQGTGSLVTDLGGGAKRYCCLGALCEVAVEDGVISPHYDESGRHVGYNDVDSNGCEYVENSFLPRKVAVWAGIKGSGPYVSLEHVYTKCIDTVGLIEINDSHGMPQYPETGSATFAEISELINQL